MVRTGVVSHPSQWPFGGYNEIRKPRRKCILIAYQKLAELTGFETYDAFRKSHKELVNESLGNGNNYRQADWSESVAVGSKDFVTTIKEKLGLRAKGRKILENDGGFQLREKMESYIANSDSKNDNIGGQNTFSWDVNHEFTGS